MSDLSSPARRDFLKTTALAAPIMLGGLFAESRTKENVNSADGTSSSLASLRNYLGKNTRLSISMWDFSWLLAQYPGGPYENLERRVAEAAERGYNTLRVDCFPSRILQSESKFPKKNWAAGVNLPQWGEYAIDLTCNVRKKVANLAALCRKHGIWLGLDSWDVAHMFRSTELSFLQTSGAPSNLFGLPSTLLIPEGDEEQAFAAYGELWVKALKLMREDGVLERAVWIAPMNEVPNFVQGSVASVIALRRKVTDGQATKAEISTELNALFRRINDYMGAPIKAEIAKDRIALSYCSNGDIDYAARLSDLYDVVDLQVLEKFDLKAFSQAWDDACRRHYPEMLERVSNFFKSALEHMTLPSGKCLQAIVTECYGSLEWPDSPDVSWEWYKRYNADALRIVASMNITGASLSNFGEPLFTLWNDLGWHWAGNNYFRSVPPPA
jgi:hypothetical protein